MKLVLACLLVAFCSAKEGGDSKEKDLGAEDGKKYLEKFGYYNPFMFGSSVEDSIKQFQKFTKLPVTGKLDDATKKQMKKKRCGRPDRDGGNAFADSAWSKNKLSYKFLDYTKDLGRYTQKKAIVRGMELWTKVTPLKFHEVYGGQADIKIGFYTGSHGDGAPFDGEGQVLAHAFFPEVGDLHFDDAETWTTGSPEGTNLDWVTTHEFGHALGLEHTDEVDAIMYPYYAGYDPNMKLHSDDIRRIQRQYGKLGEGACKDKSEWCKDWISDCYTDAWVQNYCKKTCGRC